MGTLNPNGHLDLTGLQDIVNARTKAAFLADRESNRRLYAGTGFIEFGRRPYAGVNEGMWTSTSSGSANIFYLGNDITNADANTNSPTHTPIVNVDGVLVSILGSNWTGEENAVFIDSTIDGTKTCDTASRLLVQHADPAAAFAAETATNKVVLSRTDLVCLEFWYEKLSTNDIVYPLGNVQNGHPSYKGITLSNTLISWTYSSLGPSGYGARWSILTADQKLTFAQDHENNIFYDEQEEFYQLRYRFRVVAGYTNDWYELDSIVPNGAISGVYNAGGVSNTFLRLQGKQVTASGVGTDDGTIAYTHDHTAVNNAHTIGAFSSKHPALTDFDLCYSIPVALVARRNQGAYHPDYNPNGCAPFHQSGTNYWKWWQDFSTWKTVTSTVDCFTGMLGIPGGVGLLASSQSGRPDNRYYDIIYKEDIKDLRMNARRVTDYSRLLQNYWESATEGTLRGWQQPIRHHLTANLNWWYGTNVLMAFYWNNTLQGLDKTQGLTLTTFPVGSVLTFILNGIVYNGTATSSIGADYQYFDLDIALPTMTDRTLQNSNFILLLTPEQMASRTHKSSINDSDVGYADEYLACDILGNPTNFPARWASKLPGQYIGTPNGTAVDRTLSRRAIGAPHLVLQSNDAGVTWADVTGSGTWSQENNSFMASNDAANSLILIFYTAKAQMLTRNLTSPTHVADGVVCALNTAYSNYGSYLITEVLGKHSNNTGAPFNPTYSSITSYNKNSFGYSSNVYHNSMIPFTAVGGVFTSASKFFTELVVENNMLAMVVYYNEVKTSTNDDGFITITSARRQYDLDLNSDGVAFGRMAISLPFFSAGE